MTAPADELRTAAQALRDVAPEITGRLAGLADPVAEWLDYEAGLIELMGRAAATRGRTEHALAVARTLNGTPS